METRVIAFDVQAGTPGYPIAQAVAAQLGFSYHEEDILVRAAELTGTSNEAVASVECLPSFITRLGDLLEAGRDNEFQSTIVGSGPAEARAWFLAGRNRSLIEQVIRQLAAEGRCVIAGHAAPAVLRGNCPGLFTVSIHGSIEARAAYCAATQDIDLAAAAAVIRKSDRQTADYLRHVYHIDAWQQAAYDLSLAIDGLTAAAVTELVVSSARNFSEQHRESATAATLVRRRLLAARRSPR